MDTSTFGKFINAIIAKELVLEPQEDDGSRDLTAYVVTHGLGEWVLNKYHTLPRDKRAIIDSINFTVSHNTSGMDDELAILYMKLLCQSVSYELRS